MLWPAAARADIDIEIHGVDGELRRNILAFLSFERFRNRDNLDQDTIDRLHERTEREVQAALRPFGYYDVKVESTVEARGDGRRWRVDIHVDPGQPVMVEIVDVRVVGPRAGDDGFRTILANLGMRPGQQLSHQAYETIKADLQRTAASQGYLAARFLRNELIVDPPNHIARAHIEFDTGERYRFGKVSVSQGVIRDSLMQRFLRFKEGDYFDAIELLRTQFALDDSQYFRNVEVLPGERDPETLTVPVTITAQANRRHRWTLAVGYGTDTEARGTISWENRLVNTRGHRFRAEAELAANSQRLTGRYVIPIGDPALEKFEMEATYVHQELGDLDTWNTEARAGVTQMTGLWQHVAYLRLVNAITEDPISRTESVLPIPGISVMRVPQGYLGEPLFGRVLSAEVRGSAESLGADTNYLQLMLRAERVFDIAPKWHLLLRGEVGVTWTDNFDGIPGSERFFAGGDLSVRGFGFNELSPVDENGDRVGGKDLLFASVEVIRDLPRNFGVAVFYDTGNAFNSFNDPLEYSVGVGARYRLPIATVGLDVAQALSEPGANPRLHFNFSAQL